MVQSQQFKCNHGHYGEFSAACSAADCEYYESCKYYSESPDPDSASRVRNPVSFEKNEKRCSAIPASSGKSAPTDPVSVNLESLGDILRYIITLEDNTVATISEILRNPQIQQSDLARKRGVSRQRINTSLLHICRAHPELAQLFVLCVKKITLARNRYVTRKEESASAEHPDLF